MEYKILIDEIEYCENKGLYKLADTLLDQLVKKAAGISEVAPASLKKYLDATNFQLNASLIYSLPECQNYKPTPQEGPDFANFLIDYAKNLPKDGKGQIIDKNWQTKGQNEWSKKYFRDITNPDQANCLKAFGKAMGREIEEKINQMNQADQKSSTSTPDGTTNI